MPAFPESPRCLSPFQGTWFPCTASTFKPWIDSHHLARGKALWESLVGKPHGKVQMESHRSFDPRKGKRDTAAKLGREAHMHAPTRDEDLRLWGNSRSPGRSMSALQRNPQVPAPIPHKVLGPSIDGRAIPRGPRATRMWTGVS